jgi:signal transduction histidine kinase
VIRRLPNVTVPALASRGMAGWLAAVLVAGSVALGAASVLVAATATPAMDAALGGTVLETTWVLPGGSAWDTGIRRGQTVLSLTFGASAQDWRLETSTGDHTSSATGGAIELGDLRGRTPASVLALGFAVLSVGLFAARRALAASVALGAMALATPAIVAANAPAPAFAAAVGVPLAAAAWMVLGARDRRRRAVAALAVFVTGAWVVAWVLALEAYSTVEALRVLALAVAVVSAVLTSATWRAWLDGAARRDPPRTLDLAAVLIAAAAVAAAWFAGVPVAVIGAVAAAAGVAYGLLRRPLNALAEHLILDGIREQAEIAATEDERARLAGEIHDGPLQLLAAAEASIRDGGPVEDSLELLEEAALDLRAVSAALRPPVLDDLGLGPALSWLVERTRTQLDADCVISSDVRDLAGTARPTRLPRDVELAALRIVQEAIGNAVRHADAGVIAVSGEIGPSAVDLHVHDDGRGITGADVRRARRSGRLGVSTMERRASSVGGILTVGSAEPRGTLVSFAWPRP